MTTVRALLEALTVFLKVAAEVLSILLPWFRWKSQQALKEAVNAGNNAELVSLVHQVQDDDSGDGAAAVVANLIGDGVLLGKDGFDEPTKARLSEALTQLGLSGHLTVDDLGYHQPGEDEAEERGNSAAERGTGHLPPAM